MKFGIGQSARRLEDNRFVEGKGLYAADRNFAGQGIAYMVRAPHAHARIAGIDVDKAKAMPGVRAVFTGHDIQKANLGMLRPVAAMVKNSDGSDRFFTHRPLIAHDKVRHVGEIVAMVVADTYDAALDAAEFVHVEYVPCPAVADMEEAITSNAPLVWEEHKSNIIFDWALGEAADYAKVREKAHHVTRLRLVNNRVVVNAIEPRACVSLFDESADAYTLYVGSQGVHGLRDIIARQCLNIEPDKLRLVTDDVGGGFGMKAFIFPEYPLTLFAARHLGCPVKWVCQRTEAFLSDTQGRDHITHGELALDDKGKFLGIFVDTLAGLGAYESQYGAVIPTLAAAGMHRGVYDIPVLYNRVRGVATNTVWVDAYRGAGRPEASYVLERLVDAAAHELKLDAATLRQRNFLPWQDLPVSKKHGALGIDSGNFAATMAAALKKADAANFSARRTQHEADGLLAGFGISYYIERTGGAPDEYARLVVDSDSKCVHVYAGTQSTGQGHETAWAQIVATSLGLEAHEIKVHSGDTDTLAKGHGTGGSRSAYMAHGALHVACENLIEKCRPLVAQELEVAPQAVEYRGSIGNPVFASGGSNRTLDLFAVAQLLESEEEGLSSDGAFSLAKNNSYPNGCHICEVVIDKQTGTVTVVRYTVVDDFGKLINPMLVAGQVHGGIVQGLGQAMGEHAVYDAQGQLISGSFMDYVVPRADQFPDFDIAFNEQAPNPNNALGIKGCGEAGTVGAPAAFVNAVLDAVRPLGITTLDMPITPDVLWQRLCEAEAS